VRPAEPADAPAIQRLMQTADRLHTHIDWRPPGDWLGRPGFYVYDPTGGDRRPRSMFGNEPYTVVACLSVAADPPPAAWVRLAAFLAGDFDQAQSLFDAVLADLDPEIDEINWFVDEDWSESWLARLGFGEVNRVVNYMKEDTSIPGFNAPTGLIIRPVAAADLSALARMEAAAFEPRWRHSAEALFLAWGRSLSFDVALLAGEPAGFQMSHGGRSKAHLSRMTVEPALQGRGIGAALLAHAIEDYRDRGIRAITLNTQADNLASQRLYGRFGFRPVAETYPVWAWRRR
jgi:ribosomal-protein-alanine N-acetyltransferase